MATPTTTQIPTTEPENIGAKPPRKKHRLAPPPPKSKRRRTKKPPQIVTSPPICRLARIPLEILAEVLSHMPSTKEVLAVARTSKYFCDTLVANETSGFIWRKARENTKPEPVPEPTTPNWIGREAAYAAFIWDGGECEVCKKPTPHMYTSFALKARVCGKPECMIKWRRTMVKLSAQEVKRQSVNWLPCLETGNLIRSWPHDQWYPTGDQYHRVSDAQSVIQQMHDASVAHGTSPEDFVKQHQKEAAKIPRIMELSVKLFRWKAARWDAQVRTKKKNEAMTRHISKGEGWDYWDLWNTPSWSTLIMRKNSSLEEVTKTDFEHQCSQTSAEVLTVVERRKRRITEALWLKNREAIDGHYHKLLSSEIQEGRAMPSLSEFRKLPIVKVLLGRHTVATVAAASVTQKENGKLEGEIGIVKKYSALTGDFDKIDLAAELAKKQKTLISTMIGRELRAWCDRVETEFCQQILGYNKGSDMGEWKNASRKKLHPVERLDARFQCKKCKKTSWKYADVGCLDFVGTCAHSCIGVDWKGWSVQQFEVDQKVVEAVRQLLKALEVKAENSDSIPAVRALGSRILCLCCQAPIVMDFDGLLRHCKRHEEIKIEILSKDQAAVILQHPHTPGVCAKLTDLSVSSKAKRDLKVYGCRHCTQTRSDSLAEPANLPEPPEVSVDVDMAEETDMELGELPIGGESGTTEGEIKKKVKRKKRKDVLRDMHALASHMKAKHKIEPFGDEDFFVVEDE
ncbi:hypothetical protein JAAARDRAFT_239124 [Jaapia argillacea MUCL 33604]|uniref:F-box domain-containing protein n=1 Tax=Jaapia argillacea MUCL 33604 TaxID=933084 RepID=A0A067QCP5_9AGAM|nr:hypothetical protein JAAARDRAFT_239124 [Jaapia argillacea MUCL 33604]